MILNLKKHITNISCLQTIQFLRFFTFLLISIVLTKSNLTNKEIGDFEMMLFVASLVSYFWVTGLVQSFIPLYNNNRVFPVKKDDNKKSPEIFNAFLLLTVFSCFFALSLLIFKGRLRLFGQGSEPIPYVNEMIIYILVNNPSNLIEYLYMLRNKPVKILDYGFLTFGLQLICVTVPIIIGQGVEMAIWGLILISVVRLIWMIALLKKYAEFKISFPFIKEHLMLGFPLIISTLLSGSAQYVDGLIVSYKFDAAKFAVFRYGAKELPLVVMLANGLNSGMLKEFSTPQQIKKSLHDIKVKSKKLMHILYPISIVILFFANWLYPFLFNRSFNRSSDVFMVYVLLIISRLLFPQTILIGMKHTKVVLVASIIEIVLNVSLSLFFIPYYGIVGVALATVFVYIIEKVVLICFNYFKFHINPNDYIPWGVYLTYTSILVLVFVLIDHRIINFVYS